MELDQDKPKGFNIVVTHRDTKTGLVTHTDPYILRRVGEGSGKISYWERPSGSGNLFDKKGNAIGRWDKTKPEGHRFLKGEAHLAFTPPMTDDQKLRQAVVAGQAKIAELNRELASIKAEQEKKDAVVVGKTGSQKKEQGA